MSLVLVIFILIALLILVSGLLVVVTENVIHSALWLITSFFGVGALYLLLEAEFLAVAQVLIYVGAVSILILFAIMLTRNITGEGQLRYTRRWWLALVVSAALFAGVLFPTVFATSTWTMRTSEPPAIASAPEIGTAFMREYLLPFELASVLLLVALVGAIVVAFEERSRRRRVLTLAEEQALKKRRTQDVLPDVAPDHDAELAGVIDRGTEGATTEDRGLRD